MSRLRSVWRLLNLPCEGMSRLSSESLDRDLGAMERLALRTHVLYCTACRRYLSQIKLIRGTLRQLRGRLKTDEDPLPGPRLPENTREKIKRALEEQSNLS
jgi:hypothetical protein